MLISKIKYLQSAISSPDRNGKQNGEINFGFVFLQERPKEVPCKIYKTVYFAVFLKWIAGIATYWIVYDLESISDKLKYPKGKSSGFVWFIILPLKVAGAVENGLPPVDPAIFRSFVI